MVKISRLSIQAMRSDILQDFKSFRAVLRQTDARRINEPHDQRYRERLRDVESERNPAHFKRTVPGWIACHHAVPERMADAPAW